MKAYCVIVALAAVALAVAPITEVSAGKGSPCSPTPPLAPISGVGYTLTDLGTLTALCGGPTALNDSGQVVGGLIFPNPPFTTNHAFLDSAGTMTDINPIPGGFSTAAGINGLGQVVGMFAASTFDQPNPYLYSAGTVTDLSSVLGGGPGFVSGINDAGQITGSTSFARAFRYDSSSGLLDLGTLGGSSASGTAINQKGWVVGESELAPAGSSAIHAFLFDGTMKDLGTLGGDFSFANALNSAGVVVGDARTASGSDHAFLYDGTMHDLIPPGSPFDAFSSSAIGINDAGQVVGNYLTPSGPRPFIWSAATGIMDLNAVVPAASGLTLVGVSGINNRGQIVGGGDFGFTEHPFLLTPVLGDTTPPVITYSGNAGTYTVDQQVDITCTVSDPDSAVASTTCHDIVGPAYSFNLGVNSFSATATDPAGNVGSATVTFTVVVTFDSLCNLTQQFIRNDGLAGSLCAKLSAAKSATGRGDLNAKSGMLGAYSNEAAAQSGISLTSAQVAILTGLVNAL